MGPCNGIPACLPNDLNFLFLMTKNLPTFRCWQGGGTGHAVVEHGLGALLRPANPRRRIFSFPAKLLLVLFLCGTVHAQSLKDLSLEELGNIKVTTQSKEPEEIWRTPAAISVLTQEDIRRLGAINLPELLRMLPGVFVGTVNSSNWSVGVRGFTSNFSKSLLVLIDGRSVYTPLFGGVYWAVQDTLLEDIDRIEVIRGPGGTAWGENAVNGVINIITKKSKETHGALSTTVAGNLERFSGELRLGETLGSNFSYRAFVKGFDRGPEIHPNNMDPDEWHMVRGGFRSDWSIDTRDQLTFQGDIYQGTNPRESVGVSTQDPVSGGDVLARFSKDLSHKSDNSSNVFIQGYVDRTIREGAIFGQRQYTLDLDGVYQFHPGARNKVILGAGYRSNPTTFTQHISITDLLPHQQNYRLYSIFAQDETALLGERLILTAGIKAEHNIFTNWEVEPSFRALYRANDHQTVWVAVSRAVRMPSQLEEDFRLAAPITVNPLAGAVNLGQQEVPIGDPGGV
jgi:iron complex outermembrane receptor protein